MAKQYMYLLGQWRKIDSVSGTTGSLEAGATFPSTGSASVMVANMNEIVLTGSAGLNLPKLTFSYVPRYR
jgi:filamentous hemagglutinin family protein